MLQDKYNIWKLKNGKKQGGFQLPLTEVLINRIKDNKELGQRRIAYVPGSTSIWVEDQSGESKPKKIWFEKGTLWAPKTDKLLDEILKIHPWRGVHYELFDKEAESKKELEKLRFKDKVREIIDGSDVEKRKAIAIAIFDVVALNWDDSTIELELRRMADTQPEKLKIQLNRDDYQGKYLAALAFSKNIVTTDLGKNNVIWNDSTKGVIYAIAKGENHINALADFLSKSTDESLTVLQSIGDRIKRAEMEFTADKTEEDKLSKAEAEIERLKAELAAKTNKDLTPEEEEAFLIEARAKYTELYGKEPANAFKNNLEWLNEKIKDKEENS